MQIAVNILILLDFHAMTILHTKEELQTILGPAKLAQKSIGLVPTMGALHLGHLSLVAKSLEECDLTVVSIFVNPTQFNNTEDLVKYPRNLDQDITELSTLGSDIIVFAPSAQEIYGSEVSARHFDFGDLEKFMEGHHRPGHFSGVATVVSLLFDAVTPDYAYFGEKDYQQLRIIETLVKLERRDTVIVPCSIARSHEGLALSSRNQRLNEKQLEQALLISQVLNQACKRFGTDEIQTIKKIVAATFEKHPEFELEYFEIADVESLIPTLTKEPQKKYRAFIAAHLGGVRLIDNLDLN
jgi:pantoate--beta-alanine ligase